MRFILLNKFIYSTNFQLKLDLKTNYIQNIIINYKEIMINILPKRFIFKKF